MGKNVAKKLIESHLVSGDTGGGEIAVRIDQTLTQDSTGTMAYLQFEAMGIPRVRTKLSVAYIDHNTLQAGYENADDHKYIQTAAARYGIYFSRPGNGICHQVHLERFGVPGMTLLGSDSHTPTCGALGMLAIGAGGLDVAVAMGGGPYYLNMPKIAAVRLIGRLRDGVGAKDVILEVLRRLTVKGGIGKIMEYTGEGVATLSIPERATIANMGAELGATTSVFPSDGVTRAFLKAQGREKDFTEILPDTPAEYDEEITIDLSRLEPLAAQPHSPDNVARIKDIGKIKVDQVAIGSCTNSSLLDMLKVARILKGKTVHPDTSLVIAPGSKQVLNMLAMSGALADMVAAGARILECACGPCIGMGQSPATGAVSVRTFNRNFYGRSGTESAKVYLTGPETAAASAINGYLTDPLDMGLDFSDIMMPERFLVNDNMITPPAKDPDKVEVVRGPNIKPFPQNKPLSGRVEGEVLLVMGDNITTDHIMPSNSKLLPYRSNIPYLSEYCLTPIDPVFPGRAKEKGGGWLIAGENYGQGSSREHAALVPLYLGVKGVIAKSFARIHMANLINNGLLPLAFAESADYQRITQGDVIAIADIQAQLKKGGNITAENLTKGYSFNLKADLYPRQRETLLTGGLLNYTRISQKG
ncbi:MAG: aconitate hydratase [Bacillota bacterium]|nr:aconitate hydratase [Bacillota bacterium]